MVGSESDIPEGFSVDAENPKYRIYKSGASILEYTIEEREITIDWLEGRDAAQMLKSILEQEGKEIERIAGYVTDRLGSISAAVLQRFGDRIAFKLGRSWKATIQIIAGRRYLIFICENR